MDKNAPIQPNVNDNTRAIIIGAVILIAVVTAAVFFSGSSEREDVSQEAQEANAVLQAPAAEEEESYNALAASLAEEADTLVIGKDCAMAPLVLKLSEGETLTIQNTDNVLHEVVFEDEGVFTVSPNDTRTVDLLGFFKKGEGVYRYRCRDVSDDTVGVLYVTGN